MPMVAARRISAIKASSNVTDLRGGVWLSDVFHVEMIKLASRTVAAEFTDIHRDVYACGVEPPPQLRLACLPAAFQCKSEPRLCTLLRT